ncbi:hypothetical protein KUTeg_007139 [Tegillarca granosa]|uniref:Uncharacterized protein n=1 Tax=Tegillarca granosa TaxID=220873 RepID=A0ABQ9FCE5_TEGGR|nr:hypothetical protein KUTeg_007139 [Tegillarca granosa]
MKKNSLSPSTISAFRFFVGKDELPRAVLDEEGPSLQRRKKSGILRHISENKIVKTVTEWIKQTPKHMLCYHNHSCLHYTLQGFVRMFCYGYVIQGGVKLLSSLSKILRQPSALIHALKHSDNFHLGAFLGCFVAIYRAVLEPHNLRPAYWKFLCKVTGNRFAVMNRKILEPFVPNAAKMFPDFWPEYDSRYTSITPADIGKTCCS